MSHSTTPASFAAHSCWNDGASGSSRQSGRSIRKRFPVPIHLHQAAEELLIVLRGRPTVRLPSGERQLEAGDVLHFPEGLDGAHLILNRSDSVVRFAMATSYRTPDAIEYPDEHRITVYAFTESPQLGGPLFVTHALDEPSSPT